jgi:hypothetical protein
LGLAVVPDVRLETQQCSRLVNFHLIANALQDRENGARNTPPTFKPWRCSTGFE